jgi:hypothetical protein
MSTFKIKHDKTKHSIQINTLDETHKKIMTNFKTRRDLLPKKKKKLEELVSKLHRIENLDASKYTISDIKVRSELKTDIKSLRDEIYDIENDLSELDYYFKTEDIIMDYYEITDVDDHSLYNNHPELCEEKKIEISNNNNIDKLDILNQLNKNQKRIKKVTKRRKKRIVQTNQINILDFLNGGTDTEKIETIYSETSETELSETSKVVNSDETSVKNKAELLDQYMMLIDSEYMCDKKKSGNKIRKCPICDIEKTLMHSEGIYVCQKCGETEIVIIDSEKPNYKEAVTDTKPGYPYKRSNHLNDCPYKIVFFLIYTNF